LASRSNSAAAMPPSALRPARPASLSLLSRQGPKNAARRRLRLAPRAAGSPPAPGGAPHPRERVGPRAFGDGREVDVGELEHEVQPVPTYYAVDGEAAGEQALARGARRAGAAGPIHRHTRR